MHTFILGLSVLLQFVAAGLAIRLMRLTGWRAAWALIAAGVLLMAVRRSITLGRIVFHDAQINPDLVAESVALCISLLMVGGIARIGLQFKAFQSAQEELRVKNDQLRHKQKIEAVGQLASGVAHDFNNLLLAIRGYIEIAERSLAKNHEAREAIERISLAAEQASGVANSLLTFSRSGATNKVPMRLDTAVIQAVELLRGSLPAAIDTQVDVAAAEEIWIYGDSTQINQVVLNLGINARDAMPDGGRLTIRLDERTAASSNQTGKTVDLVVSDTGHGLSPETQDRMFEPFFTTRPRGQGTGLGLSIVHAIVEDHDGSIAIESTEDQGSTFVITFDRIEPPPILIETKSLRQSDRPTDKGLVLLAEDNHLIRRLLGSELSSLGYETFTASDAESILEVAKERAADVCLLVVDYHLPGMTGIECLDEVRSILPRVPAIVITGSGVVLPEYVPAAHTALVRKPFTLTDFGQAIEVVCDRAAELHATRTDYS